MKYSYELEGEDHTHFVCDIDAECREDADQKLECIYPDARVIDCHTQDELIELQAIRYDYISRQIDEGWYYD